MCDPAEHALLNPVYKVLGSIAARDADDPLETTPLATIQGKGPGRVADV